jgi:DNA replication protein DnaC
MRYVITPEESRLLLDLIDDRYQKKSMMFISQFAVKDWYYRFEDPTIADAILDRILQAVIRVDITVDSLRNRKTNEQTG